MADTGGAVAPELDVSEWLGGEPQSLTALRGQVVLVEVFQMLCPGCVQNGIPQAKRIHRAFGNGQVTVLGLHSVFEHHDVMGRDALVAFMMQFGIRFPVGIDRHDSEDQRGAIPVTMRKYHLEGTPSTLLIDQQGRLRLSHFGAIDDLVLGAHIGSLLGEAAA